MIEFLLETPGQYVKDHLPRAVNPKTLTLELHEMPFPWYHADVPLEYRTRQSRNFQMYIQELKERASLLMRLGYSAKEAATRLRGNVRWDFELHDDPEHLEKVQEVVEAVFRAQGYGSGGSPSLEP